MTASVEVRQGNKYARGISESEGEGGREYPDRANNPGRPQAGPSSDLPYSRSKTFARMRIASSKASRIFILLFSDELDI